MINLLAPINWSSLLIVLGILAVLSIVFTLLILLVGKVCKVEEDERIGQVQEKLSGANCGGCGFAGCADFAKALVENRAEMNACASTSKENKTQIGKILGVAVGDSEPKMAVVKCSGDKDTAGKMFEYVGNLSCEAKNTAFNGDKICNFACLSGGSCALVCTADAIETNNGVAKVDKRLCGGCSACAKACPKKIIELIPRSASVFVACSSKCKGKEVLTACKVGCIGCGLCVKNCPENAISLVDNLAVIDYSKCSGCKTCVAKCPRKIIKEL